MTRRRVVAFTIPAAGHVNRMLPVVAGLVELGIPVDFFAHAPARRRIEQAGARFVDIYDGREKDDPDDASWPLLIRNVSFAGHWADEIAGQVAALEPGLVIHDTFAVIGRVVAFHLGLPRVNMQSWHNLKPERVRSELEGSGTLHISEACRRSVEALKTRHGMPDASPFSYFIDGQADLNIISEPPEFLPPDQRGPFEPAEFFGSYWLADSMRVAAADPFGTDAGDAFKALVAFGTGAWIVCPDHTRMLLEVLVEAMAARPGLRGLVSLGSAELAPPGLAERLRRPNLRVEPFIDQVEALTSASVFVTHNGLNSTHEAIFHGVPMISHPLFDDQPGLAALCQRLGLAVPLGDAFRHLPTVSEVHAAFDRVRTEGSQLRARIGEARGWELAVMERRPQVLQRLVAMMR